jgi:flagellar protein FlaG
MAMEIQGISSQTVPIPVMAGARPQAPAPRVEESEVDIEAALADLERVSLAFNRRLQFSVNKKIDQVVVKVIDRETETVIKEIPPRELQVVHERIREALGILFDVQI